MGLSDHQHASALLAAALGRLDAVRRRRVSGRSALGPDQLGPDGCPVVGPHLPAADGTVGDSLQLRAPLDRDTPSAPVGYRLRQDVQSLSQLGEAPVCLDGAADDVFHDPNTTQPVNSRQDVNTTYREVHMFHNALMDSVWDRVVSELKRRGETAPQAWLAAKLGLTEQAVANWKARGIPRGRYMDIARVLGWSVEQLTSDGLPIKLVPDRPDPPNQVIQEATLAYAGSQRSQTKVPVVGTAKLGEDGYYTELEHPVGHGDGFVEAYSSDVNAYALKVKGDSMHPTIRHGQFVIIEPNSQCVPGENVLIALHDGRKLVKELVTERPDSITVMSVNGGNRLTFDRVQVMFMHPVAGVMSASKWRPE